MDKRQLLHYIEIFKRFKQRSWKARTAKNNAYYFRLLAEFTSDGFDRTSLLLFFNHLQDINLAETTRRQAETSIISFIRWLHNEGLIEKNFGASIERTNVHHKPKILPSQAEILALIKQATESGKYDNKLTRFSKLEHRACLSFIVVACGGRNYETSQILRKDVSISGLQLELVEGKGGSRNQAIPHIPWLIEDLTRRVNGLRTQEELEVLSNRSHFKESDLERLFIVNRTKLEGTMQRVSKIWGRRIMVHDLRRIFARDLKANGATLDDIRDAMGHKDIATTQHYLIYDTSTQERTLKSFSSEARKYRSKEEKAKELINSACDLGKVLQGGLKGNILTLKVEII